MLLWAECAFASNNTGEPGRQQRPGFNRMTRPIHDLSAHDAYDVVLEPSVARAMAATLLFLFIGAMLLFTFLRDALDAGAGALFPIF